MNQFKESNITLNFADTNFFRFSDCNGYKVLSGNNFKEMDACWYDTQKNLYWLIELKDFSLVSLHEPTGIKALVADLVKKAVDSLCMLLSSKHTYPHWNNDNLPIVPNTETTFKFVTIIHCSSSQKPNIQHIHNAFRDKFKPYAQLFGINFYAVLEHSKATEIIKDIIIE